MIRKFASIEEVQNLNSTGEDLFRPSIAVLGVGGAGSNVVNNMLHMDLPGVKLAVLNTDMQALESSPCPIRIQLGPKVTKGLGAGSKPEIGFQSAEESKDEIKKLLEGINMLFITAGMGGGTGTGSSQVIAKISKDMGILTVGFVTKPFNYEGYHKQQIAEKGLIEIEKYVDSLVVISNQNLFNIIEETTIFVYYYKVVDTVLYSGIRAITDLIISKGMVNLDFNDIKTVMENAGRAMIGSSESSGDNRADKVAKSVVFNPLLDDTELKGAKKVLINITAGNDMTLHEVNKIVNHIRDEVDQHAFISFGVIVDENMTDKIRVSIVATGMENSSNKLNNNYKQYTSDSKGTESNYQNSQKQHSLNSMENPFLHNSNLNQSTNQNNTKDSNFKQNIQETESESFYPKTQSPNIQSPNLNTQNHNTQNHTTSNHYETNKTYNNNLQTEKNNNYNYNYNPQSPNHDFSNKQQEEENQEKHIQHPPIKKSISLIDLVTNKKKSQNNSKDDPISKEKEDFLELFKRKKNNN
jgi:cell division protein FtsZ